MNGVQFFEAKELFADVSRIQKRPSEAEIANGAVSFLTYSVKLELRNARIWTNGVWSARKEACPLPDFSLEVFLPRDKRDWILNGERFRTKLRRDFGLLPIKPEEIPSSFSEEKGFPLVKRIAELPAEERLPALRRLSEVDDAEAQYLLSLELEKLPGPEPRKESLQWLERSVKNGFHPAFGRLGRELFEGTRMPKDSARGLRLLRQGAELGDGSAASFLGVLFLSGKEVPKDIPAAAKYLHVAARVQDPDALFIIAEDSLNGRRLPGPTIDPKLYLEFAAHKRHAKAAFYLGSLYASGKHLTPNRQEAWKWLTRAIKWHDPKKDVDLLDRSVNELFALKTIMTEAEIESILKDKF